MTHFQNPMITTTQTVDFPIIANYSLNLVSKQKFLRVRGFSLFGESFSIIFGFRDWSISRLFGCNFLDAYNSHSLSIS